MPYTIKNTRLCSGEVKYGQRSKLGRMGVLLTLIILASLSICHAQTTNSAGGPPGSALTVMTWNIHGGEVRRDAHSKKLESVPCKLNSTRGYLENIEQEIEEEFRRHGRLDVIALQEVYRSQADALTSYLARTHDFYSRPYFVETRSCGPEGAQYNDFGIAIVSRYSFSDVERVRLCFNFKDLDVRKPYCPGREQRMLQRVTINVDGHTVHIYNTHLAPEKLIQKAQVPIILRQVSKDQAQRPVLMGDFNARPESDAYRKIRQGPFLDAWREVYGNTNECNPSECTTIFDPKGCTYKTFCPYARIDYIFPGSGGVYRVEDAQVTSSRALFNVFFGLGNPNEREHFNEVPDHLPVVARLVFR